MGDMFLAMKWIRWGITFLYAAVIYYLSSRTWGGTSLFPFADKVIHVCIYAGLGWLCAWSLVGSSRLRLREILFFAMAITALYGISDEVHQWFVPGRECDVWDGISDVIGGALGAGMYLLAYRRIARKRGVG